MRDSCLAIADESGNDRGPRSQTLTGKPITVGAGMTLRDLENALLILSIHTRIEWLARSFRKIKLIETTSVSIVLISPPLIWIVCMGLVVRIVRTVGVDLYR